MRLIDADALIADCQLAQKQADRHGREFANAFYSGGGEISTEWWCVEDMIENAPTVEPKTMQWIPCSERLPEYDGEMYLVTDYCEQINRRRLHISYCYVNREGFWSDVPMGYKVIAWMPLPKPWNGEQDE